MANKFDPYREALVMEDETIWPDEFEGVEPADRQRIARLLHDAPAEAALMDYVRTHTGFARQIVVTQQDLDRLGQVASGM